MYNFHRRNESSKPWRSRYTPKWKSLYKDRAPGLGSRRGTIYSNAASQLDRPRATVSRSSARLAPSSNLEANYLSSNFYTNFEANISPTRAAAPAFYDALAAQKYYLPANQNSGGGRKEETGDRVNQQQIDRSENRNRTRARGSEIATGRTSTDRWTTFLARRQVAAIEMRVGQNGGPLPSEASFDFGGPIINIAHATKRRIRRTRGTIKGVFCNKVYVIRKFWNNFLDNKNQEGGAKNLVFQFRGISIGSKGNGQIDGRATFGWISVARDRRHGQTKHQPTTVLRPRGASLVEGLEKRRRASMASEARTTVATGEHTIIMMDGFEKRRTHGSIQSAGTDDVSSTLQMKFFNVAVANMRHTQMVLRVHVPEQIVDISLFQGADLLSARRAMAEEINDRLGALLKVPVTPQLIRRSSLPNRPDVLIFLADVTIINQAAGTNVNFQRAMQGLTKSGGSLRTLTDEMVDKWETLATASAANQSGTPRMSFTLEPKANTHTENIVHNLERTPQQLFQEVQELYGRETEGSPLRASTMNELSGRMAIFASYVQGNAGPTTSIFCVEPELLTSLILQIRTLGLVTGSWNSLTVAVPIRAIGNGVAASQLGRALAMDQTGLPPAFTDEERSYGRGESCLRYPTFERSAACTPAYNLSCLWCGKNTLDVWTTLAFMLTEHCLGCDTQLPAALLTVDGWMERIYVAANRNGDITRIYFASTPGAVTGAIFEAIQGQQLACTPNGDTVMLAFGPGRCLACRPEKCFGCGSNLHVRANCPNNGLPWSQKIIPCSLCHKLTGGPHSHAMETCDAHLQVNDPAKQLGCPICKHKGHQATQCSVWRGANGVMYVPNLLATVLQTYFPDWQIVMPDATSNSTSGGKRAWFNTCPVPASVLPVTPILASYADSVRSFTPSPGTSTADSEQGGSRLQRWTAGGGGNEELMKLATTLYAKLDAVATLVEEVKGVQDLQTKGMELLHASAAAQTTAIGKLQTAEAKHTAFYAQLQKAHQDAMALNGSSAAEVMDEDGTDAAIPSEDSMTATRQ